jgi:hypothetical protein
MTERKRADALAFLHSEAGRALLQEAAQLPPDRLARLTYLRRQSSVEIASVAVALLELRQRARAKFSTAETMYFTPEGLPQATGETLARYRASLFPSDTPVLDACCGIGSDARALAMRGPTLAVDSNPAAALCARLNSETASVVCADVTRLDLPRLRRGGVHFAFFDPSRRADSASGTRRRVRDSEAYLPPLSWVSVLRESIPHILVKVSPAIDDAALARFPEAQIAFVSERGECKEGWLRFGSFHEGGVAGHRAIVLDADGAAHCLCPGEPSLPALTAPSAWLYEPDPAVIRAHRIAELAQRLNASQIDPQIAYLTADSLLPTPFATAYRILDVLPFHLKAVQNRLHALQRGVSAIKKRGVPLEPEELGKRLTGDRRAQEKAIVVLTRQGERILALLCEPPQAPAPATPPTDTPLP